MNQPFTVPGGPSELPPSIGVAARVAGVAGREVTVRINVRNESDRPRIVHLALLGLDPAWLPAPVRTEPLAPGAVSEVRVGVTAPRGSLAADYPFAVSAQALDPATGEPTSIRPGLADVVLTVSPRAQVQVKVVPGEISATLRRRFAVQVRNNGDEATVVHLSSTQPDGARISLRSDQIRVPAHSSRTVAARARLRRPRLFGWVGQHQFTVSALGDEAQARAEGVLLQRPLTPPVLAKGIAVVTALSLWVAMAMVFLPQFGQWVRSSTEQAGTTVTKKITEASPTGEDQAGSGDGSGGGSGDSADGSEGDGADGSPNGPSESGGAGGVVPAAAAQGLQLSGTVAGNQPGDVSVRLEPTSLVDEAAQGGIGIGLPSTSLASSGLRLASAFTKVSARRAQPVRTASTSSDGSYSFAGVRSPGYYLLTFAKPGFQTQKYVIDSSSELAKQPLEVPLSPGEGRLSGTITGPRGAVGGAEITISDGTNTVTTSSTSRGSVGSWSVEGLSTPSAYVVSATTHGMSSEARLVTLGAGASGGADLRLTSGVATLTGQLTREGEDGKPTGLGGATVTVSDGAGTVRTATTLTRGRVGWYTIPSLKAPGKYSVSLAADGFQQRTTSLTLVKGQSSAVRSARLTSAAATLTGTVSGPDGGLVGAGLVLSNADDTYKTTSTSSPAPGAYRFHAVTPGTYTLTTTMFGLTTDRVTVVLHSGRGTEINRRLTELKDGVVPNTSVVLGRVTDFNTGQELRACRTDHPRYPRCVRASVVDVPPTGSGSERSTTYTTDFEPAEQYRLPAQGVAGGLRPGLHTITISAPGYISQEIDVQVGRDQTITAPDVRLIPVPKISGTVTAAIGLLNGPSCVWVVPGTSTSQPTRADCLAAIEAGKDPRTTAAAEDICHPASATWEALTPTLTRTCAATDTTIGHAGEYSVEVPARGTYTVFVTPTDKEYDPLRSVRSMLPALDTVWNPALDRRPILDLTVVTPRTSNTLAPAPGVVVSVDPAPTFAVDPTNANGVVRLRGLTSGTVTIRATDPDDPRQSGSRELTLAPNSETTARLVLGTAPHSLVGRVTAQVFGQQRVLAADVTLRVATGYSDTASQPTETTIASPLRTGTSGPSAGCFEVRPATSDPRTSPECGQITAPDAVWESPVASARVPRVSISSAGYETREWTNQVFSAGVQDLSLVPARTTFAATVTARPAPDWSAVSVSATNLDEPAMQLTPGIATGATGSTAALTWQETGAPAGKVRPGRYRVVLGLTGYGTSPGVLRCEVAGTCSWDQEPRLWQNGTLVVTTRTAGTQTPVVDARVGLLRGTQETPLASNGTDTVTFADVDPTAVDVDADPITDLRVRVQAAGHAFGTSSPAPAPTDDVQMSCTVDGATTTVPRVLPGLTTTCTADLTQLGTVAGTVVVRTHPVPVEGGPNTPTTTTLAGAEVTATQCPQAGCAAITPDSLRFTTVTDTDGTFSITGTNDAAGLATGTWALSASHLDHFWAGAHAWGQEVEVVAGQTTGGRVLTMKRASRPVNVIVADHQGEPVTNATITRTSLGDPTEHTARALPGLPGAYRFDDVEPGSWNVRATAPGLQSETRTFEIVDGSGVQEVDFQLSPEQSTLTGRVTQQQQPGVAIKDAQVSLLCREDTGNPLACPADAANGGVASAGDGKALVTVSATDGTYTLTGVPLGTYDLSVQRRGYRTLTNHISFTIPRQTVSFDPALEQITSLVHWSLDGPTDALFSAADLTLTATQGPGGTLEIGRDESVPVPWGCYDATVTQMPDNVLARMSPLQSASGPLPADSTLLCRAGQLTVPVTTDDQVAEISVKHTLAASKLSVGLTTTGLPQSTGSPATVPTELRVTGPGIAETLSAPSATTTLWLPPATYQVTARTTTGSAFWPQQTTSVTLGSQGNQVALALTELTAAQVVQFPDLVAPDVATLRVRPGSGQTALGPDEIVLEEGATSTTLRLPAGRWIIDAAWPGGPDSRAVNVTSLTPDPLTFRTVVDQ